MTVLSFVGIGVLLAVSYYLLTSLGSKSASVYLALGATFLFALGSEVLFPMISTLFSLPMTDVSEGVALVVSKALSLGYLVGMGADLCEGLGAGMLARALVFGGRMMIFSLALPYLKDLISLGVKWIAT